MSADNRRKVVVLSGAGISADSGLQTFRDSDGLWNNYSVYEVATPEAWQRNRELVLKFYNERRKRAAEAQPNAAHLAIAGLERKYELIIITQNVDDLHERAGSSNVIHVHGELNKARSTLDAKLVYHIGSRDIVLGDKCEKGSQLRPHIVWFGEEIHQYDEAVGHFREAAKVLVVGTSLTVFPVAGLVMMAAEAAEKIIVSPELETKPQQFDWRQGTAVEHVPEIVNQWMQGDS